MSYELVQLDSIYQEDYLYTGAPPILTGAWHTGPLQYLFLRDNSSGSGSGSSPVPGHACCTTNSTVTPNGNIPGGDWRKLATSQAGGWRECAALCERAPPSGSSSEQCLGWVYDCCNNSKPGSAGCYLKRSVAAGIGTFSGDVAGCSAAGVRASPVRCCCAHGGGGGCCNASYSVPPVGMRSALALGPVGGGTLELRADGRLADWRLLNNQPPRGTKVSPETAALAVYIEDSHGRRHSSLLRTHAPEPGLPTVDSMQYFGSFPVSRLDILDRHLTQGFRMRRPLRLYGLSRFQMLDANASNVPAISFIIDIPPSNSTQAAAMFVLPAGLLGANTSVVEEDGRLIFSQTAPSDRQGQMVLSARGVDTQGAGVAVALSWEVADSVAALVASFGQRRGQLSNSSSSSGGLTSSDSSDSSDTTATAVSPDSTHGALAAKLPTANGSRTIILLTLSWNLPARMWSHSEIIGHAYSRRYGSAIAVAKEAETAAWVGASLRGASALQSLYSDNSLLPTWLKDALLNSVSALWKTGMWLQDGRYRCCDTVLCCVLCCAVTLCCAVIQGL
eukprot:COSAG01_NODE_579_length_15238_cov_10.570183_1_plen_561_part_00